ncbi:MAG: hypothetical protein JSV89_17070 [Spirochaetaceae bacterium]|nr:MAG: hypothetical protein JSV89_17070 [Spirochaetaceae bacterium]
MKRQLAPQVYRIRVQGHLDPGWSKWLGDMTIVCEQPAEGSPCTVLAGPVTDQTALRGILTRLWDLNLDIISVNRIGKAREER